MHGPLALDLWSIHIPEEMEKIEIYNDILNWKNYQYQKPRITWFHQTHRFTSQKKWENQKLHASTITVSHWCTFIERWKVHYIKMRTHPTSSLPCNDKNRLDLILKALTRPLNEFLIYSFWERRYSEERWLQKIA